MLLLDGSLGISIVLATVYIAGLSGSPKVKTFRTRESISLPSEKTILERDNFIAWIDRTIRRGRWWLQLAVVSLSYGVLFLPIAFFSVPDNIAWLLALISAVLGLFLLIFVKWLWPISISD
jgi:hypothetical protein